MPKIGLLTSSITNKIIVPEFVAEGTVEDLEFNIRHKRLTQTVLDNLANIADGIREETRSKITKKRAEITEKIISEGGKIDEDEEIKIGYVDSKSIAVHQLAYLIEYTDIFDEGGELLPPSVETFMLLSVNIQRKMLDGIMNTLIAEKKSSTDSSSGMSPAGD